MTRLGVASGVALALALGGCSDRGQKEASSAPPPAPTAAPAATPAGPPERPAPPSWGFPLIHKALTARLPNTVSCLGGVDGLRTRYRDGQEIAGWAWDTAGRRAYQRVVAVNRKGRFVGFGETGIPRPDVLAEHPEVNADAVGWTLVTTAPAPNGVQVYAVDFDRKTACLLGKIDQIP